MHKRANQVIFFGAVHFEIWWLMAKYMMGYMQLAFISNWSFHILCPFDSLKRGNVKLRNQSYDGTIQRGDFVGRNTPRYKDHRIDVD